MLSESRTAMPKIWNYPVMVSERGLETAFISFIHDVRAEGVDVWWILTPVKALNLTWLVLYSMLQRERWVKRPRFPLKRPRTIVVFSPSPRLTPYWPSLITTTTHTSTPSSILSTTLINVYQRLSTFINDPQQPSTPVQHIHDAPEYSPFCSLYALMADAFYCGGKTSRPQNMKIGGLGIRYPITKVEFWIYDSDIGLLLSRAHFISPRTIIRNTKYVIKMVRRSWLLRVLLILEYWSLAPRRGACTG